MPIYEYECPHCGRRTDIYASIKAKRTPPKCCNDSAMERYFSAPTTVIGDISPYVSMHTGEVIGGRRQHREHLKQHGLIEVGNERLPQRKQVDMPDLVPDLREAIREVRRGRRD